MSIGETVDERFGAAENPSPWYLKRWVLALWGLAVVILIATIIYGLVILGRGSGGSDTSHHAAVDNHTVADNQPVADTVVDCPDHDDPSARDDDGTCAAHDHPDVDAATSPSPLVEEQPAPAPGDTALPRLQPVTGRAPRYAGPRAECHA